MAEGTGIMEHDSDYQEECSACNALDYQGMDQVEIDANHDYYTIEIPMQGMRDRGEMRDGTPLQI